MGALTFIPEDALRPVQPGAYRPSELPVFLRQIARLPGEFLIYDDGYRAWTYTYADLSRMAGALAARLRARNIGKGDRIMIWSESRPGWIAALWACLLEGVVLVPVDQQSSPALFRRIQQKVKPRAALLGSRVPTLPPDDAVEIWPVAALEQDAGEAPAPAVSLTEDDVAEIVFTSGTTAEPKGVVLTHANLAACLHPLEVEFAPYRKYVHPFAPLRILNLLPLSHLFGQALALFVPPLIPAAVVFMSSASPAEIVRQIHARGAFAVVAVPKLLEVLRDCVVHRFPETAAAPQSRQCWVRRAWRFRALHRLFGWKFCCLVVGGAPVPSDLEQFWINLGFLVVQGYGLTETAPIISFNHPFHVHRGTAGKPLACTDVRIAADGEILVRGPNVTRGYFEAPAETASAFHDGWFHTGDVGELDAEGHLSIRGRKKDMIVTPEGLKVFPEDVEAVLQTIPGVREAAVIGKDRVHAVLILAPGADSAGIVRQANARLEDHQRIRAVSLWPGSELPRTVTTRKLKHAEIAARVEQGTGAAPAATTETALVDLVRKYAPDRAVSAESTLDELGLSSLDRVQLMMDLEEKLGASVEESVFATVRKVADLARPMEPVEQTPFPSYNRSAPARLIRHAVLDAVLLPATRFFARRRISGLQHLAGLHGPVIFAANHQSHLDTPAILASLPPCWRYRIAPAMWKEYFDAHFFPQRHSRSEHFRNSLIYRLVTLLFNAFPVPQTETGARQSIRYMGELVEEGWSILIFPEGERSRTGEISHFQPGVGMIAARLRLPVVPIRLRGTGQVLPPAANWPRTGPVEVAIGPALRLEGEQYAALTLEVENAIRAL